MIRHSESPSFLETALKLHQLKDSLSVPDIPSEANRQEEKREGGWMLVHVSGCCCNAHIIIIIIVVVVVVVLA